MNSLLVLPILIPLFAAAVSLVAWRARALQRWLAVGGTAALLASGCALLAALWWGEQIYVTQVGDWPAPYGITLVADLFSAIMIVLTGIIGLATAVYSLASIDERREHFGYYPLLHILLTGVCGAFLTGDIFNLYVWFEVMLIASFVLLALGSEGKQLRGAIVYVTLNLLASAIFLAAVGVLYGIAGSLNMADLAQRLAGEEAAPLAITLGMLLMLAFGIKAALFPLFFWLPASYHTPPVAVSALFAGLLTKVGVYALIRIFTLIFVSDLDYTHGLILIVAGLTMVTGVLGAVAQNEFRRVLSFHIVSQIGYMIMGLGLWGLVAAPELRVYALAGSIFYIIHHVIVKANLFLVSGVAARIGGSFELGRLGGLYQYHPGLSLLFLIPALSLAGMPPLSGFFAKLALVRAGLESQHYAIVATALAVGLLTLFSMTKIWAEAFWKASPGSTAATPASGPANAAKQHDAAAPGEVAAPGGRPPGMRLLLLPIVALAAITLAISLGAEPVFELSHQTAQQLGNRQIYLDAVLGTRP